MNEYSEKTGEKKRQKKYQKRKKDKKQNGQRGQKKKKSAILQLKAWMKIERTTERKMDEKEWKNGYKLKY